jgi:hypothetical protein
LGKEEEGGIEENNNGGEQFGYSEWKGYALKYNE